MTLWNFLSPQNLLDFQRKAALEQLDAEIAADHAAGYGVDVDRKLDRRLELKRLIEEAG